MTATSHIDSTHSTTRGTGVEHRAHTVHGEETKPSWKTTELAVYLVAVIGVLIASQTVGDGAADNGADYFAADKAWWYITLLTIGYLISRGLAKSGSRTRDNDPRTR